MVILRLMLSVLIFFAVLSALVLVHEFGHYIAARLMGVKAEEFGFGFPPRAIGFVKENGRWKRVGSRDQKTHEKTVWSINWLPLGGFVRMKGEEGENKSTDSFASKGRAARLLILAAGVFMNWFLAAAIFSGGFAIGVPSQTDGLPASAIVSQPKIQIADVLADSGAAAAGIQPGDFLLAVNGKTVQEVKVAQDTLSALSGTSAPVSLRIEHEGSTRDIQASLKYIDELKRPALGVSLTNTGIVRFPFPQAIVQGVGVTWTYTKVIVAGLAGLLRDLFIKRQVAAEVSGPVGIAVLTGQMAKQGVWAILQFAALLSVNLAIINALPIPALDGGRMIFVLAEVFWRRKVNQTFEATLHRIGFILLLIMVALVTVQDLRRYGGVILGGIRTLIGF